MRTLMLVTFILGIQGTLLAQTKDSSFYVRADHRVEVMMNHFSEHISADSTYTDTLQYIQKIFAYHIETIKLRTDLHRNRKPMYEYALSLRSGKFANVLPEEIRRAYINSFAAEVTGFDFCRVCNFSRLADETHCGNCGEAF